MRRVVPALLLALSASACGGGELSVDIAIGGTEDQSYPFVFVASGPAVDEGVVCPTGAVAEESALGNTARNTLICDDGSGSFSIETFVDDQGFEGAGLPVSDWTIASGTGDYTNLSGSGTHEWFGPGAIEPEPQGRINGVLQRLKGTMSD